MTTLVHVSDLHFGRHDPALAAALLEDIEQLAPDAVAISGDLTQRARRREFEAAGQWIARLPAPVLVVPGNHDIPLFDVARRVLGPYHRYRRHVSPSLMPGLRGRGLALEGITTARRSRWKEGRIGVDQIQHLQAVFCGVPRGCLKVLVSHHPLVGSEARGEWSAATRGARAVAVLERCGVDVLLSGHLHRSHAPDVPSHAETVDHAILVIHAGTAISNRLRGEANAYNVLRVEGPAVTLMVRAWDGHRFVATDARRFVKGHGGWRTQGVTRRP